MIISNCYHYHYHWSSNLDDNICYLLINYFWCNLMSSSIFGDNLMLTFVLGLFILYIALYCANILLSISVLAKVTIFGYYHFSWWFYATFYYHSFVTIRLLLCCQNVRKGEEIFLLHFFRTPLGGPIFGLGKQFQVLF